MKLYHCDWHGVAAVRLATGRLEIVATQGFGPRIASFRLNGGDNLLFWPKEADAYRRALPEREAWYLRGGHRLWMARPGADESEDAYAPDNGPCECRIDGDGFHLLGAIDPVMRTRRGIGVKALDDDTLEIDHVIVNDGPMLFSAAPWALTCTLPTARARYVVPLGDDSTWDCATMVVFRKWAGGQGQATFRDDQFALADDALVLTPQGRENKRMLQGHAGAIVLIDPSRNVTFGIRAPYDPNGRYPLGTNIALYVGKDNFMVEMETMGPEQTLKPGSAIHHVETWRVRAGAIDATGVAARQLMDLPPLNAPCT